jgi:hypothetical protein
MAVSVVARAIHPRLSKYAEAPTRPEILSSIGLTLGMYQPPDSNRRWIKVGGNIITAAEIRITCRHTLGNRPFPSATFCRIGDVCGWVVTR